MQIKKDAVVSVHYVLKDDSGQILDQSEAADPLEYLHGAGNIIPGLEAALLGKSVGEKFKVKVEPKDAYGVRNDKLVQRIPKDQFPDPKKIQKGMQFQVDGPQGPMVLSVVDVVDKDVVVDGNHELAGQTLHFEIEVTGVRAALKEELEHGHAHGAGGHHHG